MTLDSISWPDLAGNILSSGWRSLVVLTKADAQAYRVGWRHRKKGNGFRRLNVSTLWRLNCTESVKSLMNSQCLS
jgi:hypothetical protein